MSLDNGPVTREQALSVPALHRGVQLIASTVGSIPLRAFRGLDPVLDGPIADFLRQPEPDKPRSQTIAATVMDLIFDGMAVWWIHDRYTPVGTRLGWPRAITHVAPGEVSLQSDFSARIAGERVPLHDVIVFYGPDAMSSKQGVVPRGILSTAARTIRTAMRLEEAAARHAHQDVPTWVFTAEDGIELEEEQVESLLSAWEAARRKRTSAYIPGALKGQPVTGPNPEQLQLTEARQYIAAELARHLNLPPRYVGASAGDSLTYSTQAADRRDLSDLALRPWLSGIEGRLTMDPARTDERYAVVTPTGTAVRFDAVGFEGADLSGQADLAIKLKDAGLIDIPEARRMLNIPSPGGTTP